MKQLFFILLAAASFICQIQAQTEFGIMSGTVYQSQSDAKLMDVGLIRNHVSISSGYGVRQMLPGYSYITNFVWNGGLLPTDLLAYESQLRALVASMKVKPKFAMIENEETMCSDMAKYCMMLSIARKVFAVYGIPVINGGITNGAAVALACDYYNRIGQPATAIYLAKRNKKANKHTLAIAQSEAAYMNTDSAFLYYAFHYQLFDASYAKDLQLITVALQGATKKQVINTELAQDDESLQTTDAMVKTSKMMPIVVLYMTTGAAGNATTFTMPMKIAAAGAMR